MRLINIDALPDDCAWCSDALIEAINDAPTIDAVEVVRCRDCKYLDKGENESEAWSLCVYKSWQPVSVGDEHFCSWGKRKDGERK